MCFEQSLWHISYLTSFNDMTIQRYYDYLPQKHSLNAHIAIGIYSNLNKSFFSKLTQVFIIMFNTGPSSLIIQFPYNFHKNIWKKKKYTTIFTKRKCVLSYPLILFNYSFLAYTTFLLHINVKLSLP